MSAAEIFKIIKTDGDFWMMIFLIIMSFIQISPIKISPWTSLLKWLGKQLNADIDSRLNTVESKLDVHINESVAKDLRDRRTGILDFANSCLNGRKHTQEEYIYFMHECDLYEKYCHDNNIPNGVAEVAIKGIRKCYSDCLMGNDFLK